MQEVYGNRAERVFDMDTGQHDAGNHAMALADVHYPSRNTPEDVTKLKRWGIGKISIAIHTRTIRISCKRQVMDDTQLPTLYGAPG